MSYTKIEIRGYNAALFSSGDNPAKVSLIDENKAYFATSYFRPESETLPQAHIDSLGKYRLYFYRSYLPDLIDLLRNEKPLYLLYWDDDSGNTHNTHISTSREPAGESE